jgi:hypothetical protein
MIPKKDQVAGIIADNAAVMDKTMELLTEEPDLSHVISAGCVAHWGSLTTQDIGEHTYFFKIVKKAKTLTNYIKNSPKVREKLKGYQIAENIEPREPVLYVPTRWNTLPDMLAYLLESKPAIVHLPHSVDLDLKQECKSIIQSQKFWKRCTQLLAISKCLATFVDYAQGDAAQMAGVFEQWQNMVIAVKEAIPLHQYPRLNFVHEIIEERYDKHFREPQFLLAFHLNPKNTEQKPTPAEWNSMQTLLNRVFKERGPEALADIIEMKAKSGLFDNNKKLLW